MYFSFAARPSITEPPTDVTVNQGEPATFTCTAAGSGDLTIQWNCSDGSNCGSPIHEERRDGYVNSTYEIIGGIANLNVTCAVNQSLASFLSGESGVEQRLPSPIEAVRTAQLTVILATTPPPLITSDDPTSEGEQKYLYFAPAQEIVNHRSRSTFSLP